MGDERDLQARVRRVRQRIAVAGPARPRAAEDFERVALPDDHCDALRDLLVAEHASVVIEIGLGYGRSALAIGEALAGHEIARHLVIDAFQHHFDESGWDAIVEAGLDVTCTLLRERSQLALPRLVADRFVADAAFVDGSHVFQNVFVDLYFLQEIVRPRGLVILDDCDRPSVATAVRHFELNAGWSQESGGRPPRLRAYRLPGTRSEPSFEDFQPFAVD